MKHPLAQYSNENQNHRMWAYTFIGLVAYLSFFTKKSKSVESNPISEDSFKKRYREIMVDFRDAVPAEKFIEKARLDFNDYAEHSGFSFYNNQEKSVPYFDLRLATKMINAIIMNHSRHPEYYQLSDDKREIPNFPKNKSGQWLLKFIKRRYSSRTFAHDYLDFDAKEYWELLSRALYSDISEFHHFIQILGRPDMSHARNIDFNKGSMANLFSRLKRVTDEIMARTQKKERVRLLESQSPSEIFLELENGWKWVKIKDSYNRKRDDVEAQLMGHCATPEWENSFLISLRDKNQEPWVTATIKEIAEEILILGQVKGRGNDKPPQKFIEQIYELYALPEIIAQKTDDYKDWTVKDFSITQIETLKDDKPYFFDSKRVAEYFPMKKIIAIVKDMLREEGRITVENNGDIYCHLGSISELIKTYFYRNYGHRAPKRQYDWWVVILENQHMDLDYSISNYDAAEWFINNFLDTEKGQIIYEALHKELEENNEEFEDKSQYQNNLRWSFHYGEDLGSSLYDAINLSLRDSHNNSLINQLEKYFRWYLEKVSDELPNNMTLEFFDLNNKEIPIDKIYYQSDYQVYIKSTVVELLDKIFYDDIFADTFLEYFNNAINYTKDSYWNNLSLDDYSDEYALENFTVQYLPDLVELAKNILKTGEK